MILSRAKPALSSGSGDGLSSGGNEVAVGTMVAGKGAKRKIPGLKDFLEDRDYTGAIRFESTNL